MSNITQREKRIYFKKQEEVQEQSIFAYGTKSQTTCGYYYSKFYKKRKKRK